MDLSILDLAPVSEGSDAATSIRNSIRLAQAAEAQGYQRYWLAEHHNRPGIATWPKDSRVSVWLWTEVVSRTSG